MILIFNNAIPTLLLRTNCVKLLGTRGIGIRHGVARHGLAAPAHVAQPLGRHAQVQFDIAQRLGISQLGTSHLQELIYTEKILDLVFVVIAGKAATKCAQR